MRIHDLGSLEGPLLVFGGAYSNLQATEALFEATEAHGIPPERCICTGDVVAYGAHPSEVAMSIRAFGCAVVAGNCEIQLAKGADNCGCGFEDGTACDRLSAAWFAYADAQVGAAERAWMASLPDVVAFKTNGRRIAVVHGGATDVARFLWPSSDAGDFAHEIAVLERQTGPLDAVIAGHSGLCFHRRVAGKEWINAGVIGLPPHDGRPETRYAILDRGVVFHRLYYDHEGAALAMAAAGLTQGYHETLRRGIWPSEELLPDEHRR